jgi:hypothetical protein
MDRCCAKAAQDAAKITKDNIIQAIWQRHLNGSDFNVNWSNHHGLLRCDCDELVEWLRNEQYSSFR